MKLTPPWEGMGILGGVLQLWQKVWEEGGDGCTENRPNTQKEAVTSREKERLHKQRARHDT